MTNALTLLYRDPDRYPYLAVLARCAQRRNLTLDLRRWAFGPRVTRTGEEWGDLLEREEIDVIAENYWGLQTYRARGVPFVTLLSAASVWTEQLLVDPSITDITQLSGVRMAARGVGPQTLFPGLWLSDTGLDDKVEVILYPEAETGRWGHWKRVADGTCQACFMTPLYAEPARAAGLVELPYEPYAFDGGHVTLTTTENLAASKRPAMQALVDAAFDASALFDQVPQTVLRIMQEDCVDQLLEHFPAADLPRILEVLRRELSPQPIPTAAGIATAHRMRLRQSPDLAGFNPLTMWDLSFARTALTTPRNTLEDLA
jgi:hypothetical protein